MGQVHAVGMSKIRDGIMIGRGSGYHKIWPKKKISWTKCEPLNALNEQKHTDNATPDHYVTVSLQTVFGFSYYFLPNGTTKDRNFVCIYGVCAYTKS